MKTVIRKAVDYWRYLGYRREELEPYEKQVAGDNLKVLSGTMLIAAVVTAVEIGIMVAFLISKNGEQGTLMSTVKLLAVTAPILIVEFILRILLKDKLSITRLSRWLTTIFMAYCCLINVTISTLINPGDYAVVACGTFLAVQVVFDAYPEENLLFVSCAYILFVALAYFNQPFDIFLYDVLDSVPFLLVGNYLSWIKSRSKWAALINTDAKVQLEKQKLENELLQARISIMLSQIQPHFLYNALGVIYHLCDKNPQAAKKATADFSQYLRMNLDSLKLEAPVAFETELEHVQIYLSLEKMRFEENLNIVYDIRAKGFLIPALTVQPLVENAVKYGVGKAPHGGTITIAAKENKSSYQVIVSDDGTGFDPYAKQEDGRTHTGITNVKERLWSMIGATLEVKSEPGAGTTAIITVPKKGKML